MIIIILGMLKNVVHLNLLTYCKRQRSFRLSSALNKEISSEYKNKMAKLYLLPIGIIL